MSLFYNSSEAIIITSVYIKLIKFLLSFPQLFYLIQVHFNLGQSDLSQNQVFQQRISCVYINAAILESQGSKHLFEFRRIAVKRDGPGVGDFVSRISRVAFSVLLLPGHATLAWNTSMSETRTSANVIWILPVSIEPRYGVSRPLPLFPILK